MKQEEEKKRRKKGTVVGFEKKKCGRKPKKSVRGCELKYGWSPACSTAWEEK